MRAFQAVLFSVANSFDRSEPLHFVARKEDSCRERSVTVPLPAFGAGGR